MRVFVGMSGGVDSSLAAALLKDQGYDVTGVFMKNWTQDLPGMKCPWADDLADAKRVAVQLDIDFMVFDFEKEYKQQVVDYMIDEYQNGRTPNPDIMCNQEVKFKLFLDAALEAGADMIATGHYARVVGNEPSIESASEKEASDTEVTLQLAEDADKDQTYFLYRISQTALARTLFPLGSYTKKQVRQMAEERELITASKKDSQGICFVGQIGIKDFLNQYVETEPGSIIDDDTGEVLGTHEGAIFYTLGQRHGLDVGGGLPRYVIGKDMAKNEVYVSRKLDHDNLWHTQIKLGSPHWINGQPADGTYQVRLRHRAPLVEARLEGEYLTLDNPERAATPGQSAVVYQGGTCLGGGIVL